MSDNPVYLTGYNAGFKYADDAARAQGRALMVPLVLVISLYVFYLTLFMLATWSTYHHPNAKSHRLRLLNLLMMIFVTAHLASSCVEFGFSWAEPVVPEYSHDWEHEYARMHALGNVSIAGKLLLALTGLLSDSMLVWRTYHAYDRRRWLLILLSSMVVSNFILGLAEGILSSVPTRKPGKDYPQDRIDVDWLLTLWGLWMLITNSTMTFMILWRVLRTARHWKLSIYHGPSSHLLRAIMESAIPTWIGLLIFFILNLIALGNSAFSVGSRGSMYSPYWIAKASSPTSHLSYNLISPPLISYTVLCMLPSLFGISQSLLTVRIAFAEFSRTLSPPLPAAFNNTIEETQPTHQGDGPHAYNYGAENYGKL